MWTVLGLVSGWLRSAPRAAILDLRASADKALVVPLARVVVWLSMNKGLIGVVTAYATYEFGAAVWKDP